MHGFSRLAMTFSISVDAKSGFVTDIYSFRIPMGRVMISLSKILPKHFPSFDRQQFVLTLFYSTQVGIIDPEHTMDHMLYVDSIFSASRTDTGKNVYAVKQLITSSTISSGGASMV